MNAPMPKEIKELLVENIRLKKMYVKERFKADIRQDALEGKL